jgi:hypothetical protein
MCHVSCERRQCDEVGYVAQFFVASEVSDAAMEVQAELLG